jgi:hypothetical protein
MAAPISTTYNPEQRKNAISEVLIRVSEGASAARALREAREDGKIVPSDRVFWSWHFNDEQLQQDLARARLNGVEVHVDQALDVASTPMRGEVRVTKPDGRVEVRTEDMLGHRRLQVDTLLKRAQMIAPRKYGPKLDMTSDGQPLGGATEAQRIAKAAALMRQAKTITINQPVLSDRVKDLLS